MSPFGCLGTQEEAMEDFVLPKGAHTTMYTANAIRNICLLGHSGSGKTALAESLLYMTGVIDRIGKNADGNTVCDYDPEEVRRHVSISASVVPLEYKNIKINLLDTPGGFDFSGAVVEALRAADAAILVISAKDGITVGFEKAWKYCEERNMPRFIYISKVDEDNSDYNATFNALREKYGNKVAPVVVPIWDANRKVNRACAGAAAAIPANLMQGIVGVAASVVLFRLLYKVPALRERFWKG